MALGTPYQIAEPAYLANAAANIYTPPASTFYTYITQIHLANTDSSARTFTLYVGATGGSTGGTELYKGVSIAANTSVDYFFTPAKVMKSTDFLTGLASQASTITITVLGYRVAVGP